MSRLISVAFLLGLVAAQDIKLMDAEPNLPIDPNTSPHCTWYWDNVDGSLSCSDLVAAWQIDINDFRRWVSSGNTTTFPFPC